MQLRVMNESELRSLVDMPAAIAAVRAGFVALARGEAEVPTRTALEGPRGSTLFMPVQAPSQGALGLKVVSVRPTNAERGLPTIHAIVVLMDLDTGVPEAVLDGRWLTALRTGAATGVATDCLARPDASVLAVVGAGAQARAQIEAVAVVRRLDEVRIVSKTGVSASRLAEALEADGMVPRVRAVRSSREAVADADIVVTVTDSVTPVLATADVAAGAHINAVGGYRRDMQELPVELMGRARVTVDQVEAALAEAGDVTQAIAAGTLERAALVELGDVASGQARGRTSPDQVTVFKSVGNAVQDLAVARLALERAQR